MPIRSLAHEITGAQPEAQLQSSIAVEPVHERLQGRGGIEGGDSTPERRHDTVTQTLYDFAPAPDDDVPADPLQLEQPDISARVADPRTEGGRADHVREQHRHGLRSRARNAGSVEPSVGVSVGL